MSVLLRRVMIVLAVIGLGVAAYLTVVHYVGFQALACVGGRGGHSSCQTVQSSQWSKLGGVPVALIGLVGYLFILASLLIRDHEESRLATLGLTLIGFGFSAYLTYRELHSIHAICEWCVSSAAIMTLLLIGSAARYLLGESPAAVSRQPAGTAGNGAGAERPAVRENAPAAPGLGTRP